MLTRIEVPITSLTKEQLIQHIERMDDMIRELQSKRDYEIIKQNRELRADMWQQHVILEQVCEALLYHGFPCSSSEEIVKSIRRALHRMKNAEKELDKFRGIKED